MKRWWDPVKLQSWHGSDLAAGMLSLLAGALLGGGFWLEEIEGLAKLQAQAESLALMHPPSEATGQALPQPQGVSGKRAATTDMSAGALSAVALPGITRSDNAWPWLQQRMQAHGLQVLSLRPGPLQTQAGWPTQTLTLDVQGRWQDWQDFELQLHRHAPWWTVTQWLITPLAQAGDRVRVQWQGRLAWQPAGVAGPAGDWPQWTPGAARQEGQERGPKLPAPVFAVVQAPSQAQSAQPMADASSGMQPVPLVQTLSGYSADPSQWPVQALRFHGTWRQAGRTHAVLGHGPYLQVLALGQRVGREGHRLSRIDEDGVLLQSANAVQHPVHLSWSGGQQ